jgi:hypothetical protein
MIYDDGASAPFNVSKDVLDIIVVESTGEPHGRSCCQSQILERAGVQERQQDALRLLYIT